MDPETRGQQVCTACEEWDSSTSRCHEEFICSICGHTLNKCASLPGGFDSVSVECNSCLSRRALLEYKYLQRMLRGLGKS
jgi:hypothetical protein